jgi:hypothetical protein
MIMYRATSLSRPQRKARLAAAATLAVLSCAYLAVVDPVDPSAPLPVCPTKLVTGLDCPACGGLRAAHAVLRGHFGIAAPDNGFLLLAGPLVLWLVWRAGGGYLSGERVLVPRLVAYGLLGTAAVWTVLRNLPSWPWKPA